MHIKRTALSDGWELSSSAWPSPPARLGFSQMSWLPATVPGHVHVDLIRLGIIKDPFEEMAELGCQWVDEVTWSYRTRFSLQPASRRERRLLFEGLDTVARVFIDGAPRAEHDNMFVPLELDISDLDAGEHELLVELASNAAVGRDRRARYFARECLPADTLHFDERAFVRKAQYMSSWDWGPRLVSCGIWRPVSILEFAARLLDVRVTETHAETGEVTLTMDSQLELSTTEDGLDDVQLVHFVSAPQGVLASPPLRDGQPFSLRKPELWWPHGLGGQPLYGIETFLVPGDEAPTTPEAARAIAYDSRLTRVGLRRIELVREPDAFGQSFEFRVNGRSLWTLGANWIPDHSFPSLVGVEQVRRRLGCAVDLGMNMLRVWGGGLYETDAFYDAADELGLLVWQDFPYACSYYPDGSGELAAAEREARENIRRLRNHASLALWCGNNEVHEMFAQGWGDPSRRPERLHGRAVFEELLPRVVAELDPGRSYVRTSPDGGQSPNDGGVGDQHYWDVWHGRGDWEFYRDSTGRFVSEFGFASAPGLATWGKIHPDPARLDVRHQVARWHDKTSKGYETFLGYVALHYPRAKDLEEWTYFSQLNQRDALRAAIEHFRRSEFCKGSLIWQLNDCWPAQSWSVIDSSGDYKAAAYALRRLHRPFLCSLDHAEGKAAVWGIWDNAPAPLERELEVIATSLEDGRVLESWRFTCELAPGTRRQLARLDTRQHDERNTLLCAYLDGDLVACQLLCEPKDAKMTLPEVSVTIEEDALLVSADRPVIDLFAEDTRGAARFMDNFITLPRGGSARFPFVGPGSGLGALSLRCLAGRCVP